MQIEWMAPETDGYGRVTIGRWGGYFIDIVPMLFNDRLVLTPESSPGTYDHGWCYPKGNAAVLAAFAWDPETEAEPAGYIKRATPTVREAGEKALRCNWCADPRRPDPENHPDGGPEHRPVGES